MTPRGKPRRAWLPAAAACLLLSLPIAAPAQISVQVNGRPVEFGRVPPARVSGSVLIPLRAVVESLGAEVRWDAATQTVSGTRGERRFTLRIGSRDASVDGRSVLLNAPAMLAAGTTMVPLRFVAEALGAEVEWNAAMQRVVINTPDAGPGPAAGRVEGEVVAVRPGDRPPTITIRSAGVRSTYRVDAETIILRGEEGRRGAAADLGEVQPGDRVRLRVDGDRGRVEVVEAFAPKGEELIEGELVAVRSRSAPPSITVRTAAGRVRYDVPAAAVVTRARGSRPPARVDLDTLQVGDRVRLAADAEGAALRVEAVAGAPLPVVDGRVTGEVASVDPAGNPPTITIRSGDLRGTYDLAPDAVLFRAVGDGRAVRVRPSELEVGDQVRIRVDAGGLTAQVVDARAEAPAPAAPAGDLRITSFSHDARGTLRGGSTVRLTLAGTPGASVSVDAGVVARGVSLREEAGRPGRYSGSFTVPDGVTAQDVPVVARLQEGGRSAPLLQAGSLLSVDSEAPVIAERTPGDRAETTNRQPDIYVEVSDGAGSGLDPDSIRMTVDSRDVTERVKVTKRFLIYTPDRPFAPGRVPVTLSLRDQAGNTAGAQWTFTVTEAPAAVTSVTHDADRTLRAGDVLAVTVRARPRGRATFSVGEAVTALPLREQEPGLYTGSYTVRDGDQALKAPLIVEFAAPDGARTRHEATVPVSIVTRDAGPPAITSPREAFRLGGELVVEGTAAPGATVLVEVTYRGRAFGAIALKGTFGSQEVTADRRGAWVTDPFDARLPLGVRRPDLTIRAVTVDPAGGESKPAIVEIATR